LKGTIEVEALLIETRVMTQSPRVEQRNEGKGEFSGPTGLLLEVGEQGFNPSRLVSMDPRRKEDMGLPLPVAVPWGAEHVHGVVPDPEKDGPPPSQQPAKSNRAPMDVGWVVNGMNHL
jgi:hypothetical protein